MKYKIVNVGCRNKIIKNYLCKNVEDAIIKASIEFGEQNVDDIIPWDCVFVSKGYVFECGLGKRVIAPTIKAISDYAKENGYTYSGIYKIENVEDITGENVLLY